MENKIKKRKIIYAVISLIVIMIATLTWNYKKNYLTDKTIVNVVERVLRLENILECKITKIADYKDVCVHLEIPEPSEEDIKEYMDSVLEDYQQGEFTETFVKKIFQCDSIKEYKKKAAEEVVEQKKVSLIIDARNSVLDELIENSKFVLDEESVSDYALTIVAGYENEALISNMTLKEYCKNILKISYDELFEKSYEESARIIKTYLVMGAIAYKEFGDRQIEDEIDANDLYAEYQELENQVYALFIKAEKGF
ncbi:MAG: hypothetical protein HDT30_00500 [Clostridiales bacterium]|nr:hypothetical protein [Clostridiales bacterium]